jgi:hypothetical protein
MVMFGDDTDERRGPIARAGSPLACFGVHQSATKLYYFGDNTSVRELALTAAGWSLTDILASAGPGSPLTCYGFDGTDPRVYYVNPDSRIIELAVKTRGWDFRVLPGEPALDSPLTCLGPAEDDRRLYYVGKDRQVHELAPDRDGNFEDRAVPGAAVAPGSDLTGGLDPRGRVRVVYVGASQRLQVVSPDGISEGIDDTDPAPGTALTCFAMDNGDLRLYYLDRQSRVNEVAWTGEDRVSRVLPATAGPGSALTCFGAEGNLTRLYYLDGQARVNELSWSKGRWVNQVLPGTAAPDSALTCFGAGWLRTRLYYLDAQHRVNELAWQASRFVNTAL